MSILKSSNCIFKIFWKLSSVTLHASYFNGLSIIVYTKLSFYFRLGYTNMTKEYNMYQVHTTTNHDKASEQQDFYFFTIGIIPIFIRTI